MTRMRIGIHVACAGQKVIESMRLSAGGQFRSLYSVCIVYSCRLLEERVHITPYSSDLYLTVLVLQYVIMQMHS